MRTQLSVAIAILLGVQPAAVAQPPAGRVVEIRERLENANQWRDHVMVVAHRAGGLQAGKSRFPENSRAALEDAIALGAEMVELDVQKSRDGVYVVFHDSWLDRTSNCSGVLAERTLPELKTCRLVVEATAEVTSETVPTLEEMLLAARGRILVNIDNKLDRSELAGIAALAGELGVGGQILMKENLWNDARIEQARALIGSIGDGVMFMPIVADDAVRDSGLLEQVTTAVSADAVEIINWHAGDTPPTADGGPLFDARARAVAVRGDWHLWVNTYAIVNRSPGMLSGGRGDQLAVAAGLPGEAFGFWVDRGVTILQTDEPAAAIGWLEANGYRRPYATDASQQAAMMGQ